MTSALVIVCVFVAGALSSAALLGCMALYLGRSLNFVASCVSGLLRTSSLRHGHAHLSTVDDEQRLVLIPVDRLCQSIETQVALWWQSPPATPPPTHIHFDPPEGSS